MRKQNQIKVNHKRAERKAERIISRAVRAFIKSHPNPNPEIMLRAYSRLYFTLGLANAQLYWTIYVAKVVEEEEIPPTINLLLAQFIANEVTSVAYEVAANATKDFDKSGLDVNEYLKTEQLKSKIKTISRTETTRALNKSALLAMQSSGLPWKKAWVSIKDERTRNAHYVMNPKQFIPLEALFRVGNDLMEHPSDTNFGAALSNIINCRCGLHFKL